MIFLFTSYTQTLHRPHNPTRRYKSTQRGWICIDSTIIYQVLYLTLGGKTEDIGAVVVPTLGPDELLLDNGVMAAFGAIMNW